MICIDNDLLCGKNIIFLNFKFKFKFFIGCHGVSSPL